MPLTLNVYTHTHTKPIALKEILDLNLLNVFILTNGETDTHMGIQISSRLNKNDLDKWRTKPSLKMHNPVLISIP